MKMSDIFLQEDISQILHNKFVVIIGDSIQRAIYKDLVLLLQKNSYLTEQQLRKKGEHSFINDELIEGGKKGKMTNGVNYREVRQYQTDYNLVRFYFVTRCYNTYVESILADLSEDPKPDVIIMNSCLWDISRYGSSGVDDYKKNLDLLFKRMKEVLDEDCLFVWNTTLPISKNAKGGFLVPEIEFMNNTLRLDILEANFYARQVIVSYGFDVLDMHYYLRNQLHRRAHDGIHWDMTAHRRMTNMLMTHITEAWNKELPGRSAVRSQLDNRNSNWPSCTNDASRQLSDRIVSFRNEGNNPNANQGRINQINHNNNVNQQCQEFIRRARQYLEEPRQPQYREQNRLQHCQQSLAEFGRYQQSEEHANFQNSFQQRTNDNFHWQPYAQDSYKPPNRNFSRNRMNSRDVPYLNRNNNNRTVNYAWPVY